jgi:signal transduction histidine kinase
MNQVTSRKESKIFLIKTAFINFFRNARRGHIFAFPFHPSFLWLLQRLVLLYLSVFLVACSPPIQAHIQNGVLDLSGYNWEKQGLLRLDGAWEFFWKKWISEENRSMAPNGYLAVPGEWNQFPENTSSPKGYGYGTYVLHIKGNESPQLVLKFLNNNTASEVEYKNQIVYKSGAISPMEKDHLPQKKSAFIYLEDTPKDFSLIIRVSNFTTAGGGLTTGLRLGTPAQILEYTESNHLRDYFTLGSLLMIGSFHLFIFTGRTSQITSLYFGLFCFTVALRTYLGGDTNLLEKDSINTYFIFLRMEYLALPLATFLSQSYFLEIVQESIQRNLSPHSGFPAKILNFFSLGKIYELRFFLLGFSLFLSFFDLFAPPFYFTKYLYLSHINFIFNAVFSISILTYLFLKKEKYMGSLLISIGIFILLILNDVLNRNYIINTVQLFQFGFIFFVFSQSYIITSKQAYEFTETLNQKKISEVIAFRLEEQVNSRTAALQKESLKVIFQKTEIENMNLLIKSLNEDLQIETIVKKIQSYTSFRFNIENLILGRIENSSEIKPTILLLPDLPKQDDLEKLKNKTISIQENSIYLGTIRHQKIFWQRKVKNNSKIEEENEYLSYLHCKSIVYIPLFLNKEPIAFLYLFLYNSYQFGKNDLNHLRMIGEQIGSSIYNAWLIEETNKNRDIIESALRNLKESQDVLVQAEKISALGQLVAGIAHEINTPIGAIKASANSINLSIDHIISYSNDVVHELNEPTLKLLSEFLEETDMTPILITTKEERINKKIILSSLKYHGVDRLSEIGELLTMLKFTEMKEKYLPLWKHPKVLEICRLLHEMGGIRHKAKLIDLSVDKTSKIIFALKSYTLRDLRGKPILANISSGIETVLLIYDNLLRQGIELKLQLPEDIPEILCYPDELNQVWTNLLHNAIQATLGKGKLEISLQKKEKLELPNVSKTGLCVTITDNGMGIPPEFQLKIFDPFFTTKKAGEGTGLGLHICREIVRKHGGDITLESRPGFTRFFIHLPLESDLKDV